MNISYKYLTGYSDRTEVNNKYQINAFACMRLIDKDRILYLKQKGYKEARLCVMLPETCTLKNHIIMAVWSS